MTTVVVQDGQRIHQFDVSFPIIVIRLMLLDQEGVTTSRPQDEWSSVFVELSPDFEGGFEGLQKVLEEQLAIYRELAHV